MRAWFFLSTMLPVCETAEHMLQLLARATIQFNNACEWEKTISIIAGQNIPEEKQNVRHVELYMNYLVPWGWKFCRSCHRSAGAINLVRPFSVRGYCNRLPPIPAMWPVSRMLSVKVHPFERPNESWGTKNDIHWMLLGRVKIKTWYCTKSAFRLPCIRWENTKRGGVSAEMCMASGRRWNRVKRRNLQSQEERE